MFTIENDKVWFRFNADTELTLNTYSPPQGMQFYTTLIEDGDKITCPGCNMNISLSDGIDLTCNSIRILVDGLNVYVSNNAINA